VTGTIQERSAAGVESPEVPVIDILICVVGTNLSRGSRFGTEVAKLSTPTEHMRAMEVGIDVANGKLDQIVNSWLLRDPLNY
jgi:hypothetical protein